MSLRTKILGTACVMAFGLVATGSAIANPSEFAGVLSAGYSHSSSDIDHETISSNDWSFAGSAVVNTNWLNGMNLQADASFDSASLSEDGEGLHSDKTILNVSPFWRFDWGRVGVVLGYNRTDYYGEFSPGATNYGIYGEWFVCPTVTLGLKGGGFTQDYYSEVGTTTGGYVGGQATWYATPDLAVYGTFDYTNHLGFFEATFNEFDYGISAEWMFSESVPVSVYAGWMGSSFNAGGFSPNSNTWSIGLKLYMNENSSETLVDRQRSGAVGWADKFSPLGVNAFPF